MEPRGCNWWQSVGKCARGHDHESRISTSGSRAARQLARYARSSRRPCSSDGASGTLAATSSKAPPRCSRRCTNRWQRRQMERPPTRRLRGARATGPSRWMRDSAPAQSRAARVSQDTIAVKSPALRERVPPDPPSAGGRRPMRRRDVLLPRLRPCRLPQSAPRGMTPGRKKERKKRPGGRCSPSTLPPARHEQPFTRMDELTSPRTWRRASADGLQQRSRALREYSQQLRARSADIRRKLNSLGARITDSGSDGGDPPTGEVANR
jgi:hypothetical protein